MEKTILGNDKGDAVMKQVDVLKDATDALKELTQNKDGDKEEVGSWITIIGRALLAIFKL